MKQVLYYYQVDPIEAKGYKVWYSVVNMFLGSVCGGRGGGRGKHPAPLASTNYANNLITEKSNELTESLRKSHNEKSHKIIWFQLHTFWC